MWVVGGIIVCNTKTRDDDDVDGWLLWQKYTSGVCVIFWKRGSPSATHPVLLFLPGSYIIWQHIFVLLYKFFIGDPLKRMTLKVIITSIFIAIMAHLAHSFGNLPYPWWYSDCHSDATSVADDTWILCHSRRAVSWRVFLIINSERLLKHRSFHIKWKWVLRRDFEACFSFSGIWG